MKKYLITLVLVLVSFVSVNAQRVMEITDNYSRVFKITDVLAVDMDTNGQIEADTEDTFGKVKENADIFISIDFQDFDTAGNYVTLDFSEGSRKSFENVTFRKLFSENGDISYGILDSQGDWIVLISQDAKSSKWSLMIYNLSILM